MNVKELENETLIAHTKSLVQEERHLQIQILRYLKEIEVRKLHVALGFSSLFEFMTKYLGYSESAGFRRIQAMRLIKDIPAIEQKLADGKITLTTASQVQTFLKSEEKRNAPLNIKTIEHLVEQIEHKSSRQVEKHLLSLQPESAVLQIEKVRQVTETLTEIKLVIDQDLKETLDKLKLRLSHINPNMSYQDLIAYLANITLKQLAPKKEKEASHLLPAPEVTSTSHLKNSETINNQLPNKFANDLKGKPNKKSKTRFISKKIKDAVWKRDNGCCQFVSDLTGQACGSQFQIQIDHIHPFALGGSSEPNNLRLLCATHNKWTAQLIFGEIQNRP